MFSQRLCVFAIAAWSGFCVMVVEILGGKLISPYFGSSIYVWGSVIFVFMLALSIGYLLGGYYSRKNSSLFRLGVILILAALGNLPIVLAGEPILDRLFDLDLDPRYGSLSACFLLFLVPTVLAGMISPYAISINSRGSTAVGKDAGILYFVSTVGSSAGTLITSFYLVLWMEISAIIWSITAASIGLGAVGMLVHAMSNRAGVPVHES